ncbi:hypothetical protein MTR_2g069760 [Medicago truncatula]|uniref:Uncharacterized protein n=1 Tax=Medicago truncatula TaxID=3880 RepID=A0A072V9B1_MEDTR|nr:hypothetical protein MTR_2g069760 [Medicago truncatula]
MTTAFLRFYCSSTRRVGTFNFELNIAFSFSFFLSSSLIVQQNDNRKPRHDSGQLLRDRELGGPKEFDGTGLQCTLFPQKSQKMNEPTCCKPTNK